MGTFSTTELFGMTIRESANDGSDFTNPSADYRRLFLGEDGQLHVKDSAGTVTDIGAGSGAPTTAEYVTYAANGSLSSERVVTTPATGGNIAKLIRKAADETVNGSAALQNDDELFYALAASEVVRFEADIWFESGATPDFKHAFTVPAGATLKWSNLSFDTAGVIVPAVVVVTASGTSTDHAGSATPQRHVHVWGFVANGGTPGNLQYQWAQQTSNGTDTKVLANSNLMIWTMA